MVVIDELDTLDDLIMIIFYKFFCPDFGYIVKTWVTDTPDVFLEVLPETMD